MCVQSPGTCEKRKALHCSDQQESVTEDEAEDDEAEEEDEEEDVMDTELYTNHAVVNNTATEVEAWDSAASSQHSDTGIRL